MNSIDLLASRNATFSHSNTWPKFKVTGPSATIDLKPRDEFGTTSHVSMTFRDDTFTGLICDIDGGTLYRNNQLTTASFMPGNWYYLPGGFDRLPIEPPLTSRLNIVYGSVQDSVEISVLRDLYENTNGAGWANNTGWPSTPLEWEGITTLDQLVGWHGIQTEGGDVIRIDLSSNQLEGELPASLSLLTGLREFLIPSNNLSGPLPAISNLTELVHFQVHGGNRFSGALPSGVENLNKLITFLVSDNRFSGAVPVGFSNLSSLRVFRVDGNLFTTFPDFTGNANAHLMTVDIHDNYIPQADIDVNMPGGVPIFRDFFSSPQYVWNSAPDTDEISFLRSLYENTNGAGWANNTGWPSTPLEWEGITTLDQLVGWHGIQTEGGDVVRIDLRSNQLAGELPTRLSLMTGLRELLLSSNNLSGPLPSISNLTELVHFQVHGGNRFSGALPSGVENLNKLITFLVSDNRFSGAVPVGFSNLSSLRVFRVDGNLFTTFPDFTGNANAHLMTVDIHNNYIPQADIDVNMLGGTPIFSLFIYSPQKLIPVEQGLALDQVEITALRDLYTSANGANWTNNSGWPSSVVAWDTITTVVQLAGWYGVTVGNGDVTILNLTSNNLVGNLPANIGDLSRLTSLIVSNNQLTGSIPNSVFNLENLSYLYVDRNSLSGTIPDKFDRIPQLRFLQLHTNNFTGELPRSIGLLSNLRHLHVANLNLTPGPLPVFIRDNVILWSLYLHNTNRSGELPGWLGELSNLQVLHLGQNNFEGPVPASLGNITSLSQLYINDNPLLTGSIPSAIGSLPNLGTFDCSSSGINTIGTFANIPRNLQVDRCFLDFRSLEQFFDTAGNPIPAVGFSYTPQNQTTGTRIDELLLNDIDIITNDQAGGDSTLYQWQEWDGTQWLNVVGETSASLGLDTISIQDDGRLFRCEMTNSLVTGMTLYSQEVELKVIIPLTFYAVANGHWSDPSTWSETDGGLPGGKTPTKYDEVRIGDYQVKVGGPAACRLLKITAGEPTLLKITGKEAVLTVNGEVIIHNAGAVNNKILQVSDQGHFECK